MRESRVGIKLRYHVTNEDLSCWSIVCVKKEAIDKIGYYDEIFSPWVI